jgi:hypothetical protein
MENRRRQGCAQRTPARGLGLDGGDSPCYGGFFGWPLHKKSILLYPAGKGFLQETDPTKEKQDADKDYLEPN